MGGERAGQPQAAQPFSRRGAQAAREPDQAMQPRARPRQAAGAQQEVMAQVGIEETVEEAASDFVTYPAYQNNGIGRAWLCLQQTEVAAAMAPSAT